MGPDMWTSLLFEVWFLKCDLFKMADRVGTIVCTLKAKGLFQLVNGAAEKLDKMEEMEAWARREASAMFVLTSAIDFTQIAIRKLLDVF
ncbi:hypothetical protein PR048_013683 [Dryococelus australis]|uniref:Uncharacterized protein n=1 Tax=Dryococelus australis TaxID=614101 RepID=A0ABQ9HUE6_9NEOP|nr:hypothetical protein PR048_013683 [Dryococelus australis]